MADVLLEKLNTLRGKALCNAQEVGDLIAVAGSMAELYLRLLNDSCREDHPILTHMLQYETAEHIQHEGLSNHMIVCAYLLASHRRVDDCLLIFDAKMANFSTFLGLSDVLLVGAGVEETICFLRQQESSRRWFVRSLFCSEPPANKSARLAEAALYHIKKAVKENRFVALEEKFVELKRFCMKSLTH